MKNPFKALTLLCSIFITVNLSAQGYEIKETIPENERECWFFFQEFVSNSKNTKALLISSYVFRRKYEFINDHLIYKHTHLKLISSLSMNKKIEDIDSDEHSHNYDEHIYSIGGIQERWNYSSGGIAKGPLHDGYFVSTKDFILNAREEIIEEYENNGYTIYQIKFDEYDDEHFINCGVEKIEPLSPLRIPYYYKGDLRKLTQNTNSKTKSENKIKKSDIDGLTYACMGKAAELDNFIAYAETTNTTYDWDNARNALNELKRLCPMQVRDGIEQEIENRYQSAYVAEAIEAFSSTAYTYKYGQFIGSDNNAFLHRFALGFGGNYTTSVVRFNIVPLMSLMRLPTQKLYYKFQPDGENYTYTSSLKEEDVDDLQILSVSIAPTLSIWPTPNIYLRIAPEINAGITTVSGSMEAPLKDFTIFPGATFQLGFRFGILYIGGEFGMLFNKFKVNDGSEYFSKNGIFTTPDEDIEGKWIADNFNNGKFTNNSFWMISIGLNLGNN